MLSTHLEDFSNELFFEIFEYFDILDIYHSFWGINQRFNNLLQSLNNLPLIIQNENLLPFDFCAHQINRLKINTTKPIDLTHFSNLHTLELYNANSNEIEQIQCNQMSNLVNLTISTKFHISLPLELIHDIFSNGFRLLRYVNLNRLDHFQFNSKFQSLSLNSLCITCINSNIIPQILLACPYLIRFSITFFGQNCHILPPSSPSYNHLLEKFSLFDPYHKLTCDTIQILLLYIPNVKYLNLQFLCRVPFINLIESILNRLGQLERFECDIFESPNNHMVNVETIQQMNESFQYLECIENDNGSRRFLLE
ncbi:unnamed protein product [Adineta steineri]|nr:unnamed protein product [Adineta steineri]